MKLICIEAEELYEKDSKIKREDVEILQEWLKKQPHLPKIEESQLITFLHSCYYSIEATKRTIDCYFTRRTHYPDLFHYPSEDTIRKAAHVSFKLILPKKTPQGYMVVVSGLSDFKSENYNFNNDVLLTNLVYALDMHKYGFAEGLIGIFDYEGASLGHLARTNLSSLKCALDHLQEGLPVRMKNIHIINAVPFMDKILALVKPLVSDQLFKMIQIHSSLDTLYKYVPKQCLPADYGGELPSRQILQEETVKEIFDNADLLKWHDSQTVDESKRMEKLNILDSSFGIEGTFKKLEID